MNIIASDSTIDNPLEGTTFISWATDSGVEQLLPYLWKPTDNFYIDIFEANLPIETKVFFQFKFCTLMNEDNIVDLPVQLICAVSEMTVAEVNKHLNALKEFYFIIETKADSYFVCPLWCFYGDDETHLFNLIHRWNQKLKASFQ